MVVDSKSNEVKVLSKEMNDIKNQLKIVMNDLTKLKKETEDIYSIIKNPSTSQFTRQVNEGLDFDSSRLQSEILSRQKMEEDYKGKINEANNHILKLSKELENYKALSSTMFSPTDISDSLSDSINKFNQSFKEDQNDVNYVINGMDIEFKTHISQENKNMMFSMPKLLSDDGSSMSVVKLSIRPVPKE